MTAWRFLCALAGLIAQSRRYSRINAAKLDALTKMICPL